MKPVVVSRRAKADLKRLLDWLDERSPNASRRAASSLFSGMRQLSEFPHTGIDLGDGSRGLTVDFGRDGFVVRFRPTVRQITVLRVFHGRQQR